jgi:hypothetical protein
MFIKFREENEDGLKDESKYGQIRKGVHTFAHTNSNARAI